MTHRFLSRDLLGIAFDIAGQGDDAVGGRDPDMGGIDARLEFEGFDNRILELAVGHDVLPLWMKAGIILRALARAALI
jgi:hypothetical protein